MITQYDDKGKTFTDVVTKITVPVHLQTDQHLIQGNVHIRPDERLKDELNQKESFIAVTNASIYDLSGKLLHQCSFLAVNRRNIVWLFQDEEDEKSEDK